MRTEMRCYEKEKHLGDTVEMVMKCNDFIRFEMEKTVVEEKRSGPDLNLSHQT